MKEKYRRFQAWLIKSKDMLDINDAFVFGGLSAAVYGISQMHQPAAWMVAGMSSPRRPNRSEWRIIVRRRKRKRRRPEGMCARPTLSAGRRWHPP